MNVKESYQILKLKHGADLEQVKTSFRRLAFELHPDLNQDNPHAARQFQRLNEAYVLLRETLQDEPSSAHVKGPKPRKEKKEKPAKETERGAPGKAEKKTTKKKETPKKEKASKDTGPGFYFRKEEVLQNILKDPFARKVYEDIYNQIRAGGAKLKNVPRVVKKQNLNVRLGDKSLNLNLSGGFFKGLKSWFKGQMDEEKTVHLAPGQLLPGSIIRLQIKQAFTNKSISVEVPLPMDYVIGRPIKLKGLGRRIGPLKGDLYLRLLVK
ncbi:MAG: J domain-containing protein [Thermodesulfobacteriota bacterium]|nr:J domain-containing protein [Thermodesulfobacteriota bacterium]